MSETITIQYEATIARRGTLTTVVKERTFPSIDALQRWADRPENSGNVTILRYERPEIGWQDVEKGSAL